MQSVYNNYETETSSGKLSFINFIIILLVLLVPLTNAVLHNLLLEPHPLKMLVTHLILLHQIVLQCVRQSNLQVILTTLTKTLPCYQ
jgi:uncharacterized membrane protein